jgi:hypothetical protein
MPYKSKDIIAELPQHETKRWRRRKKIKRIIVHCTASENQNPFRTAKYHIKPNHISDTGCPTLCYHDFIIKSGLVYNTNDYWDWTWHCGIWNRTSIGVVMAFSGQTDPPTPIQYKVMIEHVANLCLKFMVLPKKVRGHREVPGMFTILGQGPRVYKSVCPGMAINLNSMRKDIAKAVQIVLAREKLYEGKIDGLFGKKSMKAWKLHFV